MICTFLHTEVIVLFHQNNPLLGPLPRDEFILANMNLVLAIVDRNFRARLAATHTPREDAINDGVIGLINAYDRYSDAAYPFGVFAFRHIFGEIANALSRRPTSGIRIPKSIFPLIRRIESAGLTGEPTEVIAQELGVTVKAARRAIRCSRVARTEALPEYDTRSYSDDNTGIFAEQFLPRLKPKPRRIIRMLMADYTQTEVAQELGMTRQAVNVTVARVRKDYERYEKFSA